MQQTISTPAPQPTDRTTNWHTVTGAAKCIKASPRSLYRAIRRGELRAAAVINDRGDMRICDDWLRAWLESRAKATA